MVCNSVNIACFYLIEITFMFSFKTLFLAEDSQTEEMEADNLLESLKRRKDDGVTDPTCISSVSLVECNSGELKPKK